MLFKTKLNPRPTRIPGERGSSFPAQPFKAAGTPHDQLTKKRTFASRSQSLYHYAISVPVAIKLYSCYFIQYTMSCTTRPCFQNVSFLAHD